MELYHLIQNDVPIHLLGDSGRIRQILVNLVGNALKFTQQGEITIEVELVRQNKKSARLHFAVKDTGIGIPQDRLQAIFTSFTQADSSITRKFGGTGLGLTISRQLVEMMNGRIWVESQVAKGSIFHFEIPFQVQLNPKIVNSEILPFDIRDIEILVIDENATNQMILKEMLFSFQCKPALVANERQALDNLTQNQNYGLIILDYRKAIIDGKQLFQKIRKLKPYQQIPVILMLPVGKNFDKNDFCWKLSKPVKQSQLFNTIMTALNSCRINQLQRIFAKPENQTDLLLKQLSSQKKRAKILLAEDNLVNQRVATALIKKAKLEISVVDDGQLALLAIEKDAYDLVFMDVQMPNMDGLTATRKIRKDSRFQNLPIIAMTAHAMKGDREKCIEAGMDDYITKPINPKILYKKMIQWIEM